MADRRVRVAISMAIDRKAVVKSLGGFGVPANQLVQQGVFGFVSNLPDLAFDPPAARKLLADAGYPAGFTTTLSHRAGASMDDVAGTIGGMLAQVGIRVKLETLEWPVLVSRWQAERLPFFLAGWVFDNGEALSFLTECLASRDAGREIGLFNPGFSNPRLDRMLAEQSERFEDSARLDHYRELTRVALEEMPIVPLFTRTYLFGVSEDVRWQPRLDGRLLVSEMALAR
jgi:peptide/nickel transport system substrate-binding protein